jgi:hypothetical protein
MSGPATSERPILLHPGFHKTGTTFLQSEVFTDSRLFRLLWWHDEVDRYVIRPHELDFDPRPAIEVIAEARRESRPDLIDVVSSETLSGTPFFGSRESASRAHRLKQIFGQAKVLITVRRQQSILRAMYMQYLKRGGTLSPDAFFDQPRPPDYYGFEAGLLEFHKLTELYAELFGAENVLVLTQETLERDPETFMSRLCAFYGMPDAAPRVSLREKSKRGVSPPPGGIPLLRFANRLKGGPINPEMKTPLAPLGKFLAKVAYRQTLLFGGEKARLEAAVTSRYAGAFAESNERLQRFAPCDLKALGYEMPAAESLKAS